MKQTIGIARWMFSLIVLFATNNAFATNETSRVVFEDKYQAWKKWVNEHEMASTYVWNKPFADIVALGPSAVPHIIEKIEVNPEDFHLSSAVRRITKKDFAKGEWPTNALGDSISAARMYVAWWKDGRFKTGERFVELHGKWKSLKSEKKDKEVQETYQEIIDLGIPVLPYLIDNVEQDPEFISVISKLTDGALPPTIKATDCKQWWKENKQKHELPTQSESQQSPEKK